MSAGTAVDQQVGQQVTVAAGPLRQLSLPRCGSRLLSATGGRLWVFGLPGGRGWFSKEDDGSLRRGRELCDDVIRTFACPGFFTTDELPRYGFSRADRATLFADYPGCDSTRDVLVLLAYDNRMLTEGIRSHLIAALSAPNSTS